jgi:trehalose 6-phosphate phosphatase
MTHSHSRLHSPGHIPKQGMPDPAIHSSAGADPELAASALPVITARTALFLDFDGTLVDIAPQPELVIVPGDLVELLRSLGAQLGGALAIVSGRKMADLDAFLAPLRPPTAAEHGAERRLPGGELVQMPAPPLQQVTRVAEALAGAHAGLRLEVKNAAVALHYRQAPQLESLCLETLAEAIKLTPGVEMLQGKCVLEIKPAGVSKGSAMLTFMALAPFAGRQPVFAGDDTTDEAGFAAMLTSGGEGIKIGAGHSLARYRCNSPAELRRWLHDALARLRADAARAEPQPAGEAS